MKVVINNASVALVSIASVVVVGVACSGETELADSPFAEQRRQALAGISNDVVLPLLEAFEGQAAALQTDLTTYAGDLSAQALADAQQAWRDAIVTWQRAELLGFGPQALVAAHNPAGLGLRERIYSWPSTNPCLVDQKTADAAYDDEGAWAALSDSGKGLDAIEYLLFAGTDSACPSTHSLVNSGRWEELAPELAQRRASYAARAARDVHSAAEALRAAWRDGYAQALSSAGAGSALYETTSEAFGALGEGLAYVDARLKDEKLAIPAGLTAECSAPADCARRVEHPYARVSRESALANLQGFSDLYGGPSRAAGEDGAVRDLRSLLLFMDERQAMTELEGALDTSRAALEAIQPDMATVAAEDPGKLEPAHGAVSQLVEIYKRQVVELLEIELPSSAAHDND